MKKLLFLIAAFTWASSSFGYSYGAGSGYGYWINQEPQVVPKSGSVAAAVEDTTAPEITNVTIYNNREDTYATIASNSAAIVTATITDANQTSITNNMITANLTDLGGAVAVNPDTYDTVSGLATWTLTDTTPTEGVGVVVTVSAQDASNNIGTVGTDTIVADNTVPIISTVNVFNDTESTYETIGNGSSFTATAGITDTNSNVMAVGDITGNFQELGFGTIIAITSYDTATAVGTWTFTTGTSVSASAILVVSIDARDDAGNVAALVTGSIIGDTTAPVIDTVNIYNQDWDTYSSLGNGAVVVITSSITDTNSGVMVAGDITANLQELGFGSIVVADSFNQATALATWTLSGGTSVSQSGTLVVSVDAQDNAGNQGTLVTGRTIGDTTAPALVASTIYNQNFDNYNTIANGSTAVVTVEITDTNLALITAAHVTADLAVLGGSVGVSADSFDAVTGIATWTVASVTLSPADGTLFITGGVIDLAGNHLPFTSSIITADNTAPTLAGASYFDSTLGIYNIIGQTDTLTVTCTITETNLGFMQSTHASANLEQFGGGASVNATSIDTASGLATWTLAGVNIGQYGNNSANIHVVDQAGNYSAELATLVTPDFYGEGLVLLIPWVNAATSQDIANAHFPDWSPSKYHVLNTNSDSAFYTASNTFAVTFDGTIDYASGDVIALTDALAVTTQFTFVTAMTFGGTNTVSKDIISKMQPVDGASQWTIASNFSAGANSVGRAGFAVINNGIAVVYATEGNRQNVTSNVSNNNALGVWGFQYDFTNSTVNVICDYDSSTLLLDGVLSTVNFTTVGGAITTPIAEDTSPIFIGAENFGVKPWLGTLGPILLYNTILGQDEMDRNRRAIEYATGYLNGGP